MKVQKIFYGAPGTGKSYMVNEMVKEKPKNKIFRITIHPEYGYSDFVGQLLPKNVNGKINFEFVEGVFTKALKEAYADSTYEVYLIIEELSRGNATGIFGDIFQLLDRDERFVSRYPIKNDNISSKIPELSNDEIVLPANFNILCTINTNDQSVFPMDTAFKRRFDWEYVSSLPVCDTSGKVIKNLNNPLIRFIGSDGTLKYTSWQNFYTSLNEFITDKENGLGKKEDKQIGQFFIEFNKKSILLSNDRDEEALFTIDKLIKNKLLNYLWQDIQGTTYDSDVTLFSKNVYNFDTLYSSYGNAKVFSDKFLINFLEKNINRYSF